MKKPTKNRVVLSQGEINYIIEALTQKFQTEREHEKQRTNLNLRQYLITKTWQTKEKPKM